MAGFLITKKLLFGFQILDLKVHFSASLIPTIGTHNPIIKGVSERHVSMISKYPLSDEYSDVHQVVSNIFP